MYKKSTFKDGDLQEYEDYRYAYQSLDEEGKHRLTFKGKYISGDLGKNGKRDYVEDGYFVEYYNDGQIQVERNWTNGQKDGSAKAYFRDGQLSNSANYKNGLKDGLFETYYSDGQLKEKQPIKMIL